MFAIFPSRTIALVLFGFPIHWYGLLYLLSFLVAWFLVSRIQKYRSLSLTDDDWSSLLSAAILGVIIGGRVGFILFYEPSFFFHHPSEILKVWHGGMSSHGGFLGVAIAMLWVMRNRTGEERLKIADVVIIPVAIGLMLGRLGNFINQELYGTVTTLPWGIAIPGIEGLRHPTQLYAMAKDLLIACVCFWHLRSVRTRPGETCAIFLMLYGILRTLVEQFRLQEYTGLGLGAWDITRGQVLTVPLFFVGLLMFVVIRRQSK